MSTPFTCDNCGNEFQVKPSRANRGNVRYCSQKCYDEKRVTKITVSCGYCGRSFSVKPLRLKESASGLQFCDQECYGNWRSGKHFGSITVPAEQLIAEYVAGATLRELGRKYGLSESTISGHVKKGRETGQVTRATTITDAVRSVRKRPGIKGEANSRFIRLPSEQIALAYEQGASTKAIGQLFGVSAKKIADCLKEFGAAMRGSGYSERPSICADGHRAESSLERAVDDWLYSHGIAHDVHPILPWARWPSIPRADFLVGVTYIEIWGLMGIAEYEQRRTDKLAQYQQYELDLIELFPHHIHSGDYSPLASLLNF